MLTEEQLLKKLEAYIKRVGDEWHTKSFNSFWWEADLQHRLLSLLWQAPDLKKEGVPLAHAEFPTRTDAAATYDLVLVMPDIARRIPPYFVEPGGLAKVKAEPLVAAVEIKFPYLNPYNKGVKGNIEKLKKNRAQFKRGYMVIFHIAQRVGDGWSSSQRVADLKKQIAGRQDLANLRVYCSSNHPEVKPGWIL